MERRSRNVFRHAGLALILVALTGSSLTFADQTVGWMLTKEDAADSYVLFSPMRSSTTYLVDRFGREVHTWESEYIPGLVPSTGSSAGSLL